MKNDCTGIDQHHSIRTFFAPSGRATEQMLHQIADHAINNDVIKTILDSVGGYVLVLNRERQIIAANQELIDALKLSGPEETLGRRPGELLACLHADIGPDGCGTSRYCRYCGAVLAIIRALDSRHPATDECSLTFKRDGRLICREFKVKTAPHAIDGHPIVICIFQDISAIKRREVLERVFLHDMRNMLAGIAGFSEVMRNHEQSQLAGTVADMVTFLSDEITEQYQLLYAEKGELTVNRSPMPVAELFESLCTFFAHNAISEQKILIVEPLSGNPSLTTDRLLLIRVLVNMLKNAFEATPVGGGVSIGYSVQNGTSVFFVKNPGAIPEHIALRIFQRSFSTKSESGRGIGTYAIRLIGEHYLGGKVAFTSDDAGTVFSITLPDDGNL